MAGVRSWMYDDGDAMAYFRGVAGFLDLAVKHASLEKQKGICCPCKKCKNDIMYAERQEISAHLLRNGFMPNYFIWTKHGEVDPGLQDHDEPRSPQVNTTDRESHDIGTQDDGGVDDGALDVEELFRNVAPEVLLQNTNKGFDNFENLDKASKNLLFEEAKGCGKDCTVLWMTLELMKLKACYGWSDTSFTDLLQLLADVLPKPNGLPTSTYYAKKLLCPFTLGVEKIHACPNHCILYRGDHQFADKCPTCGTSRYRRNGNHDVDENDGQGKNKKRKVQKKDNTHIAVDGEEHSKVPALVMWYLPVIDRLKRLFSNPRDAELLLWHSSRKKDGKIRHPADGRQWKKFDNNHYLDFSHDPRNIRFGLSTDGMNPFGEMTNPHSTWPVIMCIYNLPPWLCHKRKYLLLTTLISGPKQAGVDIDVFLEPLMEDMQKLWEHGVKMWDERKKEYFNLKAIIFCTINDNPARLTLTGQVKGKKGCVVCVDQTASTYLHSCTKTVYMKHRRFLPKNHSYRKWASRFDGTVEMGAAPIHRDGKFVADLVKDIMYVHGKGKRKKIPVSQKRKKNQENVPKADPPLFKKRSIFFRKLNYWPELEIAHAIDPMHVAKGVHDSTHGLFMDVPGKCKDGLKARRDLEALGIRPELHPQERANGKVFLPPASYTLTVEEKRAFCKCLRDIKVPSGFSTNIRNLVSMSDLRLTGYNSHDCLTMLTLFLAIAIRAIKHPYVKMAITRMCHFWNGITKKAIDPAELDNLRSEMRVTMCQLEMCFPPSFFDMMEHYMIHLADQIFVLGPVHMHWMFPYERHMVIMKGYVRNRNHPEGCMIEGYTTEEVIECYADYIKGGRPIGVPVRRHEGRLSGKGTRGRKTFIDTTQEKVLEAHFSVMHELQIMAPYVDQHLQELREKNGGQTEAWIMKQHKLHFTAWLKDLDLPLGETIEEKTKHRLSQGPLRFVQTWQGYDINGFTFYTKAKDKKSKYQNSGVRVDAEDGSGQKIGYYGFIDEIWELDYGTSLQIPIFKCQWVKHPQGVEVDDYGFTLVDLNKCGYKDQPWVLAATVAQVFYILDPLDEKKYIVVPGKQRVVGVEDVEDEEEYNQFDEVPFFVDTGRINLIETKLGYTKINPYLRTDGQGKLVQDK